MSEHVIAICLFICYWLVATVIVTRKIGQKIKYCSQPKNIESVFKKKKIKPAIILVLDNIVEDAKFKVRFFFLISRLTIRFLPFTAITRGTLGAGVREGKKDITCLKHTLLSTASDPVDGHDRTNRCEDDNVCSRKIRDTT